MPETLPSPAGAVLGTLGYALFVRGESGALRLLGDPPPWLQERWPALDRPDAELPVADASPFLENFLFDAAEAWSGAGDARVRSGPWVEGDDGLQLEATALLADGRAVLLIERLGAEFEHQKAVLQRARENVVAQQRLSAELQKKELLLHCVADEMNGALGNVITSLRLIEREHDPTKIRRLLDLAGQATRQQQSLIHHTLETFADELRDLYGVADTQAHAAGADALAAVRRAADAASPAFAEKRVRLTLSGPAPSGDNTRPKVVALDADRLERVLANLLENALAASPSGGDVAVRVEAESESMRVRVEDTAPPIPANESETLFARFGTATNARPSDALLRLQYCRMTVENAGGEIGHAPRDDASAGNCFWVRLPFVSPPPTPAPVSPA